MKGLFKAIRKLFKWDYVVAITFFTALLYQMRILEFHISTAEEAIGVALMLFCASWVGWAWKEMSKAFKHSSIDANTIGG
jgi:superfamily I DNA and RNA helicase